LVDARMRDGLQVEAWGFSLAKKVRMAIRL
jgi:isopropylmalate/homocitrate/citramalate synthase